MKTYLFDLDGTILSLDMEQFEKAYFAGLAEAFSTIMPKENVTKLVYLSYRYMVENVDQRFNKDRFYDKLVELSGIDRQVFLDNEQDYYLNGFNNLLQYTKPNEHLVKAIRILKEKGHDIVLATNPVFPGIATQIRIKWTGLKEEDFIKVTYFEETHACKPQLAYYQELLSNLNLEPEDCIMVGNNRVEDMIASKLGIECILITDDVLDGEEDFDYKERTGEQFYNDVAGL